MTYMTWTQLKVQFRTWLANTALRAVLRFTRTRVMYNGLILETEEVFAVPPDVIQ